MPYFKPKTILETHEVINQPFEPEGKDLWRDDIVLQQAIKREGGDSDIIANFGAKLGKEKYQQAGRDANKYLPELEIFDRSGRRVDEVKFHPSYHQLMDLGIGFGYGAHSWKNKTGEHVTHAGMVYLMSQVEPGVCCPMTMTYAVFPTLEKNPKLAAFLQPLILSQKYDATSKPIKEKQGITIGMAMTEKQGGSDIRSNSTIAKKSGEDYRLYGHKWFCSAPMCDGFLTLAQAENGLTCFFVPRWTDDNERNNIQIMRLKNKLGNKANASSEIEYHGAYAIRLGEEGKGVKTIIEMVHHTRLDTSIAPAGLMRAALREALWWVRGRSAFQRKLIDQPLMQAVLADLTLDWEASLAISFRVARAFGSRDKEQQAFARISVALAKFISNKRCPVVIYEAMECLGGSGYVEESPLPMLFRESPLNSIWEGSGNIICLDILRTIDKEPLAYEILCQELEKARGIDANYDKALNDHWQRWPVAVGGAGGRGRASGVGSIKEAEARWFTERLALLLQASILLQYAPNAVSDGFIKTRIMRQSGIVSGSIGDIDIMPILQRLG